MPAFANIADETARKWNHDRAETGYNDGVHFTAPGGRFAPNAWGLYDLHGNVAEWCLSTYKPYPYTATDGRDDPATPGEKVVRGGSWNDTLKLATSAARWRYLPYKPVYNVGFRVVVPATIRDVLAAAGKSPAD
jgi:formylglycine-generating enzyme required for sulfatase activity